MPQALPKRRVAPTRNGTKSTSLPKRQAEVKLPARAGAATGRSRISPDEQRRRKLWAAYHAAPCDATRNPLVEEYYPLVRRTAERLHKRLPSEVDVEDLVSAGTFGLIEAIAVFDEDRKIKFETFGPQRIRGAMLDHLRSLDWAPRTVRQRGAKVQNVRADFVKKHGRKPTEEELHELLGNEEDPAERIIRDGGPVFVGSLDAEHGGSSTTEGEPGFRAYDALCDGRSRSPIFESHRRDIRDYMTKGLSRAERLIIVLYYYEEMTMREIGATLDLSESRVSQMHSLILARLKSRLRERSDELEPCA